MKSSPTRTADPVVTRLAAEFFAGRAPVVPEELAAAVDAELARRSVTPSGLRAFGALYQMLESPPSPAREDAAQAVWAIMNAYGRSDVRVRLPLPRAAARSTELVLGLTVVAGSALDKNEMLFLFPAAGPDGCRVRMDRWGVLSEIAPVRLPPDLETAHLILKERLPDDWRTSDEAKVLAEAFAGQMIAEAEAAGRPPLVGSFVMKPPDYLPLLGAMDADHIRLIIRPTGIWCSFIFADGEIAPLWWSPRRVANYSLPARLGWAARVFMACLWRDATVVKDSGAFRVKALGSRRGGEPNAPRQRIIILPRSIRTMEWSDEEFDTYYDGQGRDAHNVRAHYRKLPETWRASAEAVRQADRFGYPAPPDGFTFVRPYRVGDEDAPPPPRVVARGLQVAGVALGRL